MHTFSKMNPGWRGLAFLTFAARRPCETPADQLAELPAILTGLLVRMVEWRPRKRRRRASPPPSSVTDTVSPSGPPPGKLSPASHSLPRPILLDISPDAPGLRQTHANDTGRCFFCLLAPKTAPRASWGLRTWAAKWSRTSAGSAGGEVGQRPLLYRARVRADYG